MKLAAHLTCLFFMLLACPALVSVWLQHKYGPGTGEQIDRAFTKVTEAAAFETLLMGNSRIYRGVNPERWPQTYNFAHDGDSFNQVYYKLRYLQAAHKLPKRLVLGIDYFSFSHLDSSRVEYYSKYFPPEFSRDFWVAPPPQRWGEPANLAANAWMERHFQQSFPLLFQPRPRHPATLSEAGQYRLEGDPERPYLRSPFNPVRRDSRRLPVLMDYFQRSLELCKNEHVEVILVMPPCNHFERDAYAASARREFWGFLAQFPVEKISFEHDRRFSLRDFQDFTHLKLAAADRFSDWLWELLPRAGAENPPASGR